MLFESDDLGKNRVDVFLSGGLSRPRLFGDLIGFLIASYAVALFAYVINNTSHTPTNLRHVPIMLLAATYAAIHWFVSQRFGNLKNFGVRVIALTVVAGSIVYSGIAILVLALLHGYQEISNGGLGLPSSLFLIIVVFPFVMVVRLVSTPIVRVFERPDDIFNTPH